jgi:hypothetical protein
VITAESSTATPPTTASLPAAGWLAILCGALGAAVVTRLWIAPLSSSLWLDELGTWWVTHGRFTDILPRARLFPQSLPYAAIVWLTRAVAGAGEAALRMPSIVAGLLAAWIVYALGRELFDRETGLLAAGIFVAFPPIVAEARDARPYALAVLAVLVATWLLVRWARTGRTGDAAAYAVAAAATVYLHYLFAPVLLAHAAWLWLPGRRGMRVRTAQVVGVVAAVAILTAPAAALVLEISRTAPLHSFREAPEVGDVAAALLPHRVLWPLAACALVVLAATRFRFRLRSGPGSGDSLRLLLLWLLVPVALLAAAAWATGAGVFDARYVIGIVPAQALLLAFGIRGIATAAGRRAVLALYLAAVLLGRGLGAGPEREDWRDAAAAVRAANHGRPVLLGGTFVESRSVALVRDPDHDAYLRAPLDYYDAGGTVAVLPLREEPESPGGEAERYAEGMLAGAALAEGFALIERSSRFPSWSAWLDARARRRGLAMRRVWDGERLRAWVWENVSQP